MKWEVSEKNRTNHERSKVKVCFICGFSNELSIDEHHIIPISEGGTDEDINKVNLCCNCHKVVHKDSNIRALFFRYFRDDMRKKERKVLLDSIVRFCKSFIVKNESEK